MRISKNFHLENSKHFQFLKFPKTSDLENFKKNFDLPILKIIEFPIWKIRTIFNLKYPKKFQFRKFQKILIWKILKNQ